MKLEKIISDIEKTKLFIPYLGEHISNYYSIGGNNLETGSFGSLRTAGIASVVYGANTDNSLFAILGGAIYLIITAFVLWDYAVGKKDLKKDSISN